MKMLRVAMVTVVLMTVGSVRGSSGQMFPTQPVHQNPGLPKTGMGTDPATDSDPTAPHRAEQQAKLQNVDRQKRLVADTDKLLSLATDLKQQVDKTTKDTMSVDVIKKAEEIEKLAHSVKERMKG
jgi:hypothetical protein